MLEGPPTPRSVHSRGLANQKQGGLWGHNISTIRTIPILWWYWYWSDTISAGMVWRSALCRSSREFLKYVPRFCTQLQHFLFFFGLEWKILDTEVETSVVENTREIKIEIFLNCKSSKATTGALEGKSKEKQYPSLNCSFFRINNKELQRPQVIDNDSFPPWAWETQPAAYSASWDSMFLTTRTQQRLCGGKLKSTCRVVTPQHSALQVRI